MPEPGSRQADHVTGGSTISVDGRELHYRNFGDDFSDTPLVFLHEGLGSVELWREFPHDVVTSSQHPGVAYSRYGNGWSSPLTDPRQPDYMHAEALQTLPEVLDRLLGEPPILVGHSDGASIALIYSGAGHPVAGLVLIAPHVFVEPETVASIKTARDSFPVSDMAEKMARYHTDPETTFYGWADIWLSPDFRSWNIEQYLPGVNCSTLLIQGDMDEYGTVKQLDAIEAGLDAPTERLLVPSAYHSPHLSHPDLVTSTITDFIHRRV